MTTLETERLTQAPPGKQAIRLGGPGPTEAPGGGGAPRNVTVLLGGPSAERKVSLVSGQAIAAALRRLGHPVTEADISPQDPSALDAPGIDAVFIALHGDFGESGDVQALCEERGLSYTGSGPQASRLAMDKVAAKELFRSRGLQTPDWAVLEKTDSPSRRAELLAALEPPVVVKPVDGGSSVDVVIARSRGTRTRALAMLLDKYGRVLVERFIAGREMTVGVLDSQVLPVLEIIPSRKFYDYKAKYADGSGTRYRFDHGLSPEAVRSMESAAWAAFESLGCRDMARVDFILDERGVAWLLEVNTIPGFTGHSLLPMAAVRAGVSFDQLVGRILESALARSRVAFGSEAQARGGKAEAYGG